MESGKKEDKEEIKNNLGKRKPQERKTETRVFWKIYKTSSFHFNFTVNGGVAMDTGNDIPSRMNILKNGFKVKMFEQESLAQEHGASKVEFKSSPRRDSLINVQTNDGIKDPALKLMAV
ncbi:Hypothetical predicted protein [Octopus vulgaris]|uniref:Uncharacterized protein n=1 Tax=Octopus vulgaris TaxID=6645 RepID=A0AA36FFE5_OCTVU|nr:Hypothetical predicted protein [Octopus vulgaris]